MAPTSRPPGDWEATYEALLERFGWNEEDDRRAAEELRPLVPRHGWLHIGTELKNRPVATVVGRGPQLARLASQDLLGVIIAADGAVGRLREMGVTPRIVVTDLDGPLEDLQWAAAQGSGFVVHAHGHNRDRLPLASMLGPFVAGTYQCTADASLDPLRNLGGFTDGDRAVLLCEALRVRRVHLAAFDFTRPIPSTAGKVTTKAAKLDIARHIIEGARARGLAITGLAGS